MVFRHTNQMMACDVSNGIVSGLDRLPANADVYAGNREYHGYCVSYVGAATRKDDGKIELLCVNVATGAATTPHPFQVAGYAIICFDITGACVVLLTDVCLLLLDPHTNHIWEFSLPIEATTASAWRMQIGCYVGDRDGTVYGVTPHGIRFAGTTPPQLEELHALADASCIANTVTHTSVLFADTGQCVDFKRQASDAPLAKLS